MRILGYFQQRSREAAGARPQRRRSMSDTTLNSSGKNTKSKMSYGCIWKILTKGNWEHARFVLEETLAAAKSSTQYQGGGHQTTPSRRHIHDAHADLPAVSYAVWYGAPVGILECMAEINPLCLSALDSQGRTVLHVACSVRDPSLNCIDYILSKHPTYAYQKDDAGNLPLHYAARSACTVMEDNMRDNKIRKHKSFRQEECLRILLSLLMVSEPHEEMVTSKNNRGETPLDVAVTCSTADLSHHRKVVSLLRSMSLPGVPTAPTVSEQTPTAAKGDDEQSVSTMRTSYSSLSSFENLDTSRS